jgi:hypothetical protein
MVKILSNFLIKLNLRFNLNNDENLQIKNDKFEDFMVVALHVLINCNALNKKLIKKCIDESKQKFKSENYINFESQFWKFNNSNNLQIFLKPASIKTINNKLYIVENHYMSIKPLVRKNPLNKKSSKLKNINFVNLKTNMKLYVRWGFFDEATSIIFNHYGYNPQINQSDFSKLVLQKQKDL